MLGRPARSADQPPNCPSAQPALLIHVQPNARRTEVAGRHGDAIKIKVAAPPVNGAANAELIRFLADAAHGISQAKTEAASFNCTNPLA